MVKTTPLGALATAGGALVAVGLLVLMLVVEASPAGATFPGENGKIAYAHDEGTDYEIYRISPTGGPPFRVTNNNTFDYSPSYSPNGRKIAYEGWDANDQEIFTINATGGMPFNVTSDNGRDDRYPSWGSRPPE